MSTEYITLRDWRLVNFVSQQELAKKIKLSQATVSLVENNIKNATMVFKNKFKTIIGEQEFNKIKEFNSGRNKK